MEQIYLYFLILVIPFLAQISILAIYKKYKSLKNKKGISGFEVARAFLDSHGLESLYIVESKGAFTDYYDVKQKVIRLSTEVFHGESIAAIAIAARLSFHAIQDKEGYSLFKIRSFFLPLVNYMIYIAYILFFLSLFLQMVDALFFAIGFLFFVFLFQLGTLPIEINASKRALQEIEKEDLITEEEKDGVVKTLKSAAFIYVASLFSSVINLIYSLVMHNRRD